METEGDEKKDNWGVVESWSAFDSWMKLWYVLHFPRLNESWHRY
jgi:hypothetical protein